MDNRQSKVRQKIDRDYIKDTLVRQEIDRLHNRHIGQTENRHSHKLCRKYMQYQFKKKVDKFTGKTKIDTILS